MSIDFQVAFMGITAMVSSMIFTVFQLRAEMASPQGMVAAGWCRHRLAAFRL